MLYLFLDYKNLRWQNGALVQDMKDVWIYKFTCIYLPPKILTNN